MSSKSPVNGPAAPGASRASEGPAARVHAGAGQAGGGAPRSITADLLRKYDKPGPRYTSYPTAGEFNDAFDEKAYIAKLEEAAASPGEPLSFYAHLPFCEERCSFCGCFVIITQKQEVSVRYLDYLHREIAMLAARLKDRRRLVQYHWGGGTPTYLSV